MSYFLFLFYTKLLDLFYTKMLDLNLAIVNCFCFLSQKLWLHNTFCISACKNTKKKTRLDPFCLFFVQNKFVLTKILPKWHLKSTFSVKKETVLGLSLSLDVLIYIIRYSKPKSEDWRFNLQVLWLHVYIHG